MGSLTKDQVATGLRQTKNLLVGANLDPATLRGARPGTAIAVLDPRQPGMIHDWTGGCARRTRNTTP